MLTYPVSCGGVCGFGCNLKIVTIPPTSEQSNHTHTHTHTHTYLLQGIIGKIIVLNLRAEVTINNLIFLSSI